MTFLSKLPNGLLSFIITIACYVLLGAAAEIEGGDESSSSLMALLTLVAMTFFINFPIAWFIVYKIVKNMRK